MLFHTLHFFIFFIIVYSLYISISHKWQNRLLLVASYVFYGFWDYRFLLLIFASTAVDFFCGEKIFQAKNHKTKKTYLLMSLITNLGLLGFFKYFNFFISSVGQFLELIGIHVNTVALDIILPVGISFYTFQTLSYTIDIYRQKLEPEKDFFDFALFVSFFPQLVAGPIERAKKLIPQVTNKRFITYPFIREGLWFFFYGFFLKVFMADNMAKIANAVFAPDAVIQSGSRCLLGIYAFAFQIFGDFAGYSFMAIGIAKLLGFSLMTNFLFPYFVTNPRDFWQNWHISLSTWLRDYLYIPLGGNRSGKIKTYVNLLITMVLGGLWHGAKWTFVLWGLYQGVLLIIHRLFITNDRFKNKLHKSDLIWKVLSIVFMFHLTCLGWLIFRASSITQIKIFLHNIFNNFFTKDTLSITYLKQIIFYSALFFIIQIIQMKDNDLTAILKLSSLKKNTIFMLMFIGLIYVYISMFITYGSFKEHPFIYFQF